MKQKRVAKVDEKIAELLAAGWKMLRYDLWVDLDGRRHMGPAEAWRAMRRSKGLPT